METLKHIAWALALLVITGVLSLSFETAWMENYTFGLIIVGVLALSVLANSSLICSRCNWSGRKKRWIKS